MKERLDTIPVNDAFLSGDECPFCYLKRLSEQRTIRYVAGPGASYMEPDVREVTDRIGFCPDHLKKLYDYGNTLGNALMLQTYFLHVQHMLRREIEDFQIPEPKKLFSKPKVSQDGCWKRMEQEVQQCYICQRLDESMERYYRTFFAMIKEEEFRSRVENCRGFCLHHFGELLRCAETMLQNGQRQWFYDKIFPLMEENLQRLKEDLDWLVAKYDYRNAGADWKNSRDALPRAMQKLGAPYVAEKPYQEK